MLRNLVLAALLIALLCVALVYAARRAELAEGGGASSSAGGLAAGASAVEPGSRVARDERSAAPTERDIARLAERSARLMPPGYEGLRLTMTLDELRRVRPGARGDEGRGPSGEVLWHEDTPDGARAVYLFAPSAPPRLAQVQILSRITRGEEIGGHFRAMQDRYGRPTGVWHCPEGEETSAMRRFTWRGEGASVMEALLLFRETLALTLVIAATDDVGAALRRSNCRALRPGEDVAAIPVVTELRGEQARVVREVPGSNPAASGAPVTATARVPARGAP